MKKLIKSLMPPILLDKLLYARSYKNFLKYKDLVAENIELKDTHKGKRCFILGSGPSIKKEDLKPLKNEIVFALNNFYVHDDFAHIMSADVDKYYMTAPIHPPQTEDEWREWFVDMGKYIPINVNMVLGLNSHRENIKYILDKHELFKEHKIYWYYAGVNLNEYYRFNKKDIDITNMIWSANTVSIYALIFAIYMGFEEIYLLGMDHNYMCIKKESDYRFYKNALHQKEEHKKINFTKKDEFIGTGKVFEFYDLIKWNTNANIINCSNESLLDIYTFKNITDVIK